MNDDALRNALVGEKHFLQYTSDAAFHAAIYQLAALLPMWVDAIAEQYRGQAAENQRLYERLANAPFPPLDLILRCATLPRVIGTRQGD